MRKPGIYFASALHHAPLWRDYAATYPITATSSWIYQENLASADKDFDACTLGWAKNLRDIRRSDFVLFFAAVGDRQRGALVEAGAALAYGIPVLLSGDFDQTASWCFTPGVIRTHDIPSMALTTILNIWKD